MSEIDVNELPFITYLSCGFLGDFIHQLSVVNEIYIRTGKKGVIYLSEQFEKFRTGVEHTFKDTYDIVKSQEYIEDYKIYNGETIHLNLSAWRQSNILYRKNYYHLFLEVYGIPWCKHKFLNMQQDNKWSDKVLINITDYRYNNSFDFKSLYAVYGDNLQFISMTKQHYDFFKTTFQLDIPYYSPSSLIELCSAISSCKLFIGTGSALLSLAFAFHTKAIILSIDNPSYYSDNLLFKNIENDIEYLKESSSDIERPIEGTYSAIEGTHHAMELRWLKQKHELKYYILEKENEELKKKLSSIFRICNTD